MAWEPRFTLEEVEVINHFRLSSEILHIVGRYRDSQARYKVKSLLGIYSERLKGERNASAFPSPGPQGQVKP